MALVTNHMLRKKLSEVQMESSLGVTGISTTGNTTNTTEQGDELVPVSLTEKEIDRVQGEEFIAKDNTRAKLYFPIPCLQWRCLGAISNNGLITLEKPIKGLFISDGGQSYLLGVTGETDEFEILLKVGENEIRLNNLFLNMKADLFVANGLEKEL